MMDAYDHTMIAVAKARGTVTVRTPRRTEVAA